MTHQSNMKSILLSFISVVFAMLNPNARVFVPVHHIDRSIVIDAYGSNDACWRTVKAFAAWNRVYCEESIPTLPSDTFFVVSKAVQPCLKEEPCEARLQCEVLRGYNGCSKGFLQSGVSGEWQMNCIPGLLIVFNGTPGFEKQQKAKCLTPRKYRRRAELMWMTKRAQIRKDLARQAELSGGESSSDAEQSNEAEERTMLSEIAEDHRLNCLDFVGSSSS